MRCFIFLCLLLPLFYFCPAQQGSGSHARYSFREAVQLLKSHGYVVSYPSFLAERCPSLILHWNRQTTPHAFLEDWLAGLNIGFAIEDRSILLYYTGDSRPPFALYRDVSGVVVNAVGEPLAGATISVEGSGAAVSSNSDGSFRLPVKDFFTKVVVSSAGYTSRNLVLPNREISRIVLAPGIGELDAVVVQAYGTTSRRLTTASFFQLSDPQDAEASPPGGNLLAALNAQVPGLSVRMLNGVPGSASEVLLGGRHSIQQNNEPLFVVEGVPWATNGFLSTIGSGSAQGAQGASLLNSIPVQDIASVTVLRDASATAVYGSRAANGVVLITLKKGEPGTPKLSVTVNTGIGTPVKVSPLLSTRQFLQLREEAVRNDGLPVDRKTVPEAFIWDSTQQTNFQQLVMGGLSFNHHAGFQWSDGNSRDNFFLSGQQHREGTVFPFPGSDQRRSIYGQLEHRSGDKRLRSSFAGMYSWERNRLPILDYSEFAYFTPNAPAFTEAAGQAQWGSFPLSFVNIPALVNNDYVARVRTLFGRFQASYKLSEHLSLEGDLGYQGIRSTEQALMRLAGQDPDSANARITTVGNRYHLEVGELL
ncbi:MAG TPA: TonB-dependent receptor plug domain-containing protein, partial [Puia sp.]